MPPQTRQLMDLLNRNRDILLPIIMITILIIMVIPIPAFMLDFMLACSIMSGLLIFFVAIYALRPLDFSVFPSLLLLVTLFRLSLNIASTRLILLNGHTGPEAAGKIILSFGDFAVGGDYVVGIIVFLILVIINFVVITKGSGRVSEVSARFTLDAMPGKQMGIDADLNSGLINEKQARERRSEIEREADFYGAMDGAAKFVRGDAIAGLIITGVNIFGGLLIGWLHHGMGLAEAAKSYTLLTIGDGLVSQIPALIISTSAGIIVTRAASQANLSESIAHQLFFSPRALGVASIVLMFFALLPSLPFVPFAMMSIFLGVTAYFTARFQRQKAELETKQQVAQAPPLEPEKVESLLPLDIIALEVGYGLIALVDAEQNGDLLDRIKSIRRQFALDSGFVVPPLHIRDNLELKPGGYSILIKGCEVARGELMTGHLLAMNASGAASGDIKGVPTEEPAFGLPALWITERDRERAQALGYTVVDLSTVVATHLTETIKRNAKDLLTRQDAQGLLDQLAKKYPKVVDGLIPGVISLPAFHRILQNLLGEQVSIRDLLSITETIGEVGPVLKNPDDITEHVRQALARGITQQHIGPDGRLRLMVLDQEIEEAIQQSIRHTEGGSFLAMDPGRAQQILNALKSAVERFNLLNAPPIVACIPQVRKQLSNLTEKFIPGLVVLSHAEIAPEANIESLGVVRVAAQQVQTQPAGMAV
ncbi:flagellar biosynthesis protein FlhA [Candidatus Sumerlaeota bacterium]|nr:flagellar biosynthesis protein FlhA [Candidatus Sumerlaeota bacterium]